MPWLDPTELRIGLGCMRLPADERLAHATIRAAADAGITVFDTAHAYAPEQAARGHNERLLARALRAADPRRTRVVTKGGMTRPGGRWVPDGRAKALATDCEASLEALEGLPIDLYLIHAPDPRTPWGTSMRALARLAEQGLVAHVGVANVTRAQLEEAVELAPVVAVQVALSPFDDRVLRGGVVSRCTELGVTVIAHSPLGGPNRAGRLARREDIASIAARLDATAAEVTLAWLLRLAPGLVAIPGARRPQTARSAALAASLQLSDEDEAAVSAAFGETARHAARVPSASRARTRAAGEIVLVMGIPGAGKSRLAAGYVEREYIRLNRDERGGSLRALADELEVQLAGGIRHAVLDNTYLTRASRSYALEAGARYGVPVNCVWLDTPLDQAQVNLVERLVQRFGLLPAPEQVREAARREPWLMLPTAQMRALRQLEPPSTDEGFTAVERVPFSREPLAAGGPGVFIGAAATREAGIDYALGQVHPSAPRLLFDWVPDGDAASLQRALTRVAGGVSAPVDTAICPHAGGPPRCWCRPPLPGLPIAFARAHGIDPARSTLIGCSRAHLSLAKTLGARYLDV